MGLHQTSKSFQEDYCVNSTIVDANSTAKVQKIFVVLSEKNVPGAKKGQLSEFELVKKKMKITRKNCAKKV